MGQVRQAQSSEESGNNDAVKIVGGLAAVAGGLFLIWLIFDRDDEAESEDESEPPGPPRAVSKPSTPAAAEDDGVGVVGGTGVVAVHMAFERSSGEPMRATRVRGWYVDSKGKHAFDERPDEDGWFFLAPKGGPLLPAGSDHDVNAPEPLKFERVEFENTSVELGEKSGFIQEYGLNHGDLPATLVEFRATRNADDTGRGSIHMENGSRWAAERYIEVAPKSAWADKLRAAVAHEQSSQEEREPRPVVGGTGLVAIEVSGAERVEGVAGWYRDDRGRQRFDVKLDSEGWAFLAVHGGPLVQVGAISIELNRPAFRVEAIRLTDDDAFIMRRDQGFIRSRSFRSGWVPVGLVELHLTPEGSIETVEYENASGKAARRYIRTFPESEWARKLGTLLRMDQTLSRSESESSSEKAAEESEKEADEEPDEAEGSPPEGTEKRRKKACTCPPLDMMCAMKCATGK